MKKEKGSSNKQPLRKRQGELWGTFYTFPVKQKIDLLNMLVNQQHRDPLEISAYFSCQVLLVCSASLSPVSEPHTLSLRLSGLLH